MEYKIIEVPATDQAERKRVCCNCGNNIRSGEPAHIECHCAIDGHYIGYVACFEHWCRRWKRDRTWDEKEKLK